MKNTILILTSLLFLTGVSEGKEVSYLQDRNGIKYEVNTDVGFTGKYISYYKNGQKAYKGNYKDGKEEGLHISWHSNGQKKSEGKFKNGKKEGLQTNWNMEGQKVSETIYKDGVLVFKEKVVVKDDNSGLTHYAHVHCNTLIQEKYGSDHAISMPQKPLNVWEIGDDDYVVNGEVNVSDNGASIANKYVCRIKFDDGAPSNIDNWSLYDISGLAYLD